MYIHEMHLPIGIILLLMIFAIFLSLLLGILNLKLIDFLFQKEFHTAIELSFYIVNLVFYLILGLFSNRAGILLLIFCIVIYFPFRLQRNRVFFRIAILGIVALTTALLTFQILQFGEWTLFHLQIKLNQKKIEISPQNWSIEGKTITNKDLPLVLHLSENMFFHKPSQTLGESRNTGSLVGIISNSDSDPSIYPYIKIYFVPSISYADIETISREFEKYLEFEKNQGDIESLQSIGAHTLKNKHKGKFWIFYDNLRPKNAKAGFYLILLKNGDTLILELREKLLEDSFHVSEIQEILDKMEILE